MTQLVVSGNRVLAHGEDCFLAMGGTVICTATGRKFENATVVNHDGAIPNDIDTVGYEYHAGDFVPCAPFGTGTGNIAVFCDDSCKALKDSGVSVSDICKVKVVEYGGTGGRGSLKADGIYPLFVVICQKNRGDELQGEKYSGVITRNGGYSVRSFIRSTLGSENSAEWAGISSYMDGNTLRWYNSTGDAYMGLNAEHVAYIAVVVGLEV